MPNAVFQWRLNFRKSFRPPKHMRTWYTVFAIHSRYSGTLFHVDRYKKNGERVITININLIFRICLYTFKICSYICIFEILKKSPLHYDKFYFHTKFYWNLFLSFQKRAEQTIPLQIYYYLCRLYVNLRHSIITSKSMRFLIIIKWRYTSEFL